MMRYFVYFYDEFFYSCDLILPMIDTMQGIIKRHKHIALVLDVVIKSYNKAPATSATPIIIVNCLIKK